MDDADSPVINKLLGWVGYLITIVLAACAVFIPAIRGAFIAWLKIVDYDTILILLVLLMLLMAWVSLLCLKFFRLYMEAKRPKDYHDFLKPLHGQGICIDTRNNEIVCPSCNREGVLSYMRKMDHYGDGKNNRPIYLCFACMKAVPEKND